MHYIPMTVLEFSFRFRMGGLSAPRKTLMNGLGAAECQEEALRHVCGLFNEESDVVFVGFGKFESSEDGWVTIPSWEVKVLHPLNAMAGMIIVQKLSNITVGEVVPDDLREKVLSFRNRELARQGSEFLMKHFKFSGGDDLGEWTAAWQRSLDLYRADHHFSPETLHDHLVKYERSKMFEITDVGFLEDSASIAKQSMLLPDGYVPGKDPGNTGHLDEAYGILRQVAGLRSGWISEGNISIGRLLQEVTSNEVFETLNSRIEPGTAPRVNTFAMMIIYLKFRALVRDINSENGEENFSRTVATVRALLPKETQIALMLAGMRFGISQFSTMFTKPDRSANSRYSNFRTEKSEPAARPGERTYHYDRDGNDRGMGNKRNYYDSEKTKRPGKPPKQTSFRKKPLPQNPVQEELFVPQKSDIRPPVLPGGTRAASE